MIELRRLRAFVAIAEEGHLTRAATRLGMQQPPLTRLLQGIEAELGVALMRRSAKGMTPTPAGVVLLQEARALLTQANGLAETVRRAALGESGRLAIGFTSSAALHPFVPAALRAFREASPAVAVSLEEGGTGELVDALRRRVLDAAFVRTAVTASGGLAVDDVLCEGMVVALPGQHHLAAASDRVVSLAELSHEDFVLYRRHTGPGLYDAIIAACRDAGFSPTVVQEAPRLTATLSLVAAGLGLSIVPASMRGVSMNSVVYRPISPDEMIAAPIYLVMRTDADVPALARFRSLIAARAAFLQSGTTG